MNVFSNATIGSCYFDVIEALQVADKVGNTRELTDVTLYVLRPSITNFKFPVRQMSTKYADAELQWYWTADNSCKSIGAHAKKWLEITDDGETSNSAYGYILFKKYKNQLEEVIELLKQDPTTRRAVLNISDPAIDRIHTKDMQCTIAIQFLLRDNQLNTTVYMRSNDVVFGLPYDYVFFMTLATYIAKRLNVKIGKYTHHATSMHLYEADFDRLKNNDEVYSIDVDKYFAMYEEWRDKDEE